MLRLPEINAGLNASSAALLIAGYVLIRRRNVRAHHWCMIGAFALSALFLVGYLTYHAQAGVIRFRGSGWIRQLYFSILIPHTILAAAIVPLAIITLTYALRQKFASHRRIAHWTLPIWLFVSVSGVVVYWMLYRL